MSLYRKPRSPFWYYRFQIGNREFRGTTQTTSQREARRIEREQRAAAEAAVRDAPRGAPLTFGQACELWWAQTGQHLAGDGPGNAAWSLDWLKDKIGPGRKLIDIDDALVAELVATRRAEAGRHGQKLAPATVNRSVTQALRKVLIHAREIGAAAIRPIKWARHLLKEPDEIPRELSAAEEARLFAAVREDYAPLMAFSLVMGFRKGEALRLRWSDIDWGARAITVHGKAGKVSGLPLPGAARDLLWELRLTLLEETGLPELPHGLPVFTYKAERTRDGRIAGRRYPITASGLNAMWKRLRTRAGIEGYRWHDHRHTAGTRVLRASGNLKIVQKLLRHASIETTLRYAHVTHDDIAAAVEAAARHEAGTQTGTLGETGRETSGRSNA